MPISPASLPRKLSLVLMTGLSALIFAPQAFTQITPTPAGLSMRPKVASVADLVERISPAVVNIVVRSSDGDTVSEGQGSGFIISKAGEVVTNYHVIDGGTEIEVVFNNGVAFPARIMGTDEETDLALLKIDSPEAFHAVKWYQGKPVRIGDWVIAIGNPFGIGQSTSLGIISAIGRDRVESGAYVDYIQTDATINRGNSGGPLFNPHGEVIGVNSAIFSPTGASVGIGFSIPHDTAEDVVNALRADGRVRRGWLGAGLRTAEFSGGGDIGGGANINNIVPGSPAQQAGLVVDDIILAINDQPVRNAVEATRIIGLLGPGRVVKLLVERAEQEMTVSLKMAERPAKDDVEKAMSGAAINSYTAPSPQASPAPRPYTPPSQGHQGQGGASAPGSLSSTGLSVVDLSASFRSAIGMRYDQVGVYVDRVQAGSPAADAGIKANMVFLEYDEAPIPSVSEFRKMIRASVNKGRASALLKVLLVDNGQESYMNLPLSGSTSLAAYLDE